MKTYAFLLSVALASMLCACRRGSDSKPEVTAGSIVRINIHPKAIRARPVDVWLPDGYSRNEQYPVIYMNDGQMLFDSTITWNREAWHVDRTITRLAGEGRIRKCIVVAIPSNPETRQSEYLPYPAIDRIAEPARSSLLNSIFGGKPLSDEYLKFIVEELKPRIDSTFSTDRNRKATFIAGSGLGGLISVYALCNYPEVFGGAISMSTHWPVIGPGLYTEKVINGATAAFRDYFAEHLPFMHARKIYFDHGTAGLDSIYNPYQQLIDSIMKREDFTGEEWMTKIFRGLSGDDISCGRRFSVPLEFILGKASN